MLMVTRRRTQSHWPTTFSMVAMMKRNLWVLILAGSGKSKVKLLMKNVKGRSKMQKMNYI
ncbi:unnamed protein product [Brassica napus]|uniref:(rape) hypothetical protein n=1 Tax=Brassica napus TaxID=3708 RepID=A0A816VZP9_BRANA|nr:unnamed protein product [Brassica napus]